LSFLCLAKKQEENVIHITTLPGVFVLITMPGEIPGQETKHVDEYFADTPIDIKMSLSLRIFDQSRKNSDPRSPYWA
jgi:hypothetical protein